MTDNKTPEPKPTTSRRLIALLLALAVAVAVLAVLVFSTRPAEPTAYSDVISELADYDGYDARLDDVTGRLELSKEGQDTVVTYVPRLDVPDIADELTAAGVTVTVSPLANPSPWTNILAGLLPVILIIGFLLFFMTKRGMGIPGLGLGKKSGTPVEVPTTRFSDVAGVEEATADLAEVVQFLHDSSTFKAAGAQIPRGFLLVGPPGTGKTLLARAVAGEAGVPFFAISGSDLVEMFVGLGASRVRELFAKARATGRAIVFIDEIDAIGRTRGGSLPNGGSDEREATLNQLLVEMDGFAQSDTVIVLAATNRVDVLDPALLRPGRFDRKIVVPVPDRAGREQLLELYTKGKQFADGINWSSLARRTVGMTGADIGQLMNEAALCAARRSDTVINSADLESALATSMLGRERRSAVMTEYDRTVVAWHEAGHTVAGLVIPGADRPVSVTIIPRGISGGSTWLDYDEDQFMTRSKALSRLTVAMAGRAAEEILLDGDYTHGAHGDLESATNLALNMVTRLGMSQTLRSVPPEAVFTSGALSDEINTQVQELISAALEQARVLVRDNASLLNELVVQLLDKETLTDVDLKEIAARFEVTS